MTSCQDCRHLSEFGLCNRLQKYPVAPCDAWKKQPKTYMWAILALLFTITATYIAITIALWGAL